MMEKSIVYDLTSIKEGGIISDIRDQTNGDAGIIEVYTWRPDICKGMQDVDLRDSSNNPVDVKGVLEDLAKYSIDEIFAGCDAGRIGRELEGEVFEERMEYVRNMEGENMRSWVMDYVFNPRNIGSFLAGAVAGYATTSSFHLGNPLLASMVCGGVASFFSVTMDGSGHGADPVSSMGFDFLGDDCFINRKRRERFLERKVLMDIEQMSRTYDQINRSECLIRHVPGAQQTVFGERGFMKYGSSSNIVLGDQKMLKSVYDSFKAEL